MQRSSRTTLLMLSLAGGAVVSPAVVSAAQEPAVTAQLIARLPESAARASPAVARAAHQRVLRDLYQRRRGALLWSHAGSATAPAHSLIDALRAAPGYGLSGEDYGALPLAARLEALSAAHDSSASAWASFDAALSDAALRLLEDLHFGRIDPHAASFDMPRRQESFDGVAGLEHIARDGDVAGVLAEVEPNYLHYRLLRQSLSRYRELAARNLPALPRLPRRSVKAGESYAGAAALRELLSATGALPPQQALRTDPVFDDELAAALRRFQYLHGLAEDGALGRSTYAALNVPLAQRARQIELTLERWRWVPPLRPPTVIVNIPQFRLFLIRSSVDREADMLRMNVIVGRVYPRLHTPVFTTDMTAVLFRPFWDVPPSIARSELLPELQRNPGYLGAQNLELVARAGDASSAPLAVTPESLQALAAGRLRLRQDPGPDNALGLIKFEMPNAYDVYLHSTPAPRLFEQPRRAFSHGCIRVSDPVALAGEVMRGTPGDWTPEKIRAAMDGEATLRVTLAQPLQVLILYGTAVATEDGALHFFDDIYGEDRRLEELLGLSPVAARR